MQEIFDVAIAKYTIQRETLTNPHFNSFDEINFDELLDITLLLDIIKALVWGMLIG